MRVWDIIVVGSGFCGATIANLAARDGKRVLMLEKRPHIAGNMYDYWDSTGILVQRYGPHIFHTSNDAVFSYLTGIEEWREIDFDYAVNIGGELVRAPFDFATVEGTFPPERAQGIIKALQTDFFDQDNVSITELLKSDNPEILEFASFLYEKNYRPYALKQWQREPEELTEDIIGRMPIRLLYEPRYFLDKHVMLPVKGFSRLFEKMLSSELIDVRLETDATDYIALSDNGKDVLFEGDPIEVPVVYTGPLENLVYGQAGCLPYRSLRIEFAPMPASAHSKFSVIGYPSCGEFLRTADYSRFMFDPPEGQTIISYEYPTPYTPDAEEGNEPYYPVLTLESVEANRLLQRAVKGYSWLFPCGRLADFRYYNMDKAIERAFEVYKSVCAASGDGL